MRLLIIALTIAVSSACATYALIDPRSNIDEARATILNEYLLTYCQYDPRQSPEYRIAKTALLSRLTIKTGIGEIALAEYAKCKVWITGALDHVMFGLPLPTANTIQTK